MSRQANQQCSGCGSRNITDCKIMENGELKYTRHDCDNCGRTLQITRHSQGFANDMKIEVNDKELVDIKLVLH